jgi:hypothetical protein
MTGESWAGRSSEEQFLWQATCNVPRRAAATEKGEQGYDIRNDEALPSLQTAINKKGSHRYRTVRLRPASLAGVAAVPHKTAARIVFPYLYS